MPQSPVLPGADSDADNLLQPVASTSTSGADSATVASSVQRHTTPGKKHYSVEEISPIPIGYKSGNKGKRKCRRSEVLTATPMKDILCAKEAARTRREAKGTGTRKRLNQLSQAKPKSAKKQKGVQCRLNFCLYCSSKYMYVSLIQCRPISLC